MTIRNKIVLKRGLKKKENRKVFGRRICIISLYLEYG